MPDELALIFNRFSTLTLDVRAAGTTGGELIQQAGFNGGGNQRWRLVEMGQTQETHSVAGAMTPTSRPYQIISVLSGKALAQNPSGATQVIQVQQEPVATIANAGGRILVAGAVR